MRRTITCWMFLGLCHGLTGQPLADFENFNLPAAKYINDASPEAGFASGDIMVPNFFDPTFQYWEGWAISAVTDNQTPGYQNQYSAIPGGGADGTAQYAVGYSPTGAVIHLTGSSQGQPMDGMYVTNSTYAYMAMRDGDAFAKKFGGATGMDPDFFSVTIRAWKDGLPGPDSLVIYLADYRSPDPADDFILDEWLWVDLSLLGPADSLTLKLQSSDVGSFGMNTPAYFCIDEVRTNPAPSATDATPTRASLRLWPNPVDAFLQVACPDGAFRLEIRDLQGIIRLQTRLDRHTSVIEVPVQSLPRGYYILTVEGVEGRTALPFVRH